MTELDSVHFDIDWPEGKPFQVVSLGLNAVDWICVLPSYPEHNSKLQIDWSCRLGGGQAATAAALCARYGLKVRYIGRVGDDETGRFSLEDLRREPMDLSCVDVVTGASSQYAIILVDRATGERTILWQRDPKLLYRPGELRREWVAQGQLLHLDGHDHAASLDAARWAHEARMLVSVDIDALRPGVEKLLELTDFALPTIDFVRRFSGREDWKEGLMGVAAATRGFVAATRGKQGAAAVWDGQIIEVPAFPINAVDTTGAGDVFHGAFVYSLFQGWSAGACLRFANAAGALACTRYGARGGIPPLDEVMRML